MESMRPDDQFAAFVREQTPGLFRVALVLTGDRHRSADLVQETLCRLYPKWDKVQSSDSPAAYVRKALVNQFLSESRRRMSNELPYSAVPDGVDDRTAEAQVDRRLAIAGPLSRLAPKQRAAVTLHFLCDLADRDGARTMGCTLAAYRGHLRRGLGELRTSMASPAGAGTSSEGWQ